VEYVGNDVIWNTLCAKYITYDAECLELNFNKILIKNIQSDRDFTIPLTTTWIDTCTQTCTLCAMYSVP